MQSCLLTLPTLGAGTCAIDIGIDQSALTGDETSEYDIRVATANLIKNCVMNGNGGSVSSLGE